eukprot:TRINITY_DN7372_c3_g1_i1.p1 TRINITY_DN7372_c3_g1~~TRINITY_DN7372_c3_g1_i1.p1  ORF type:complete len:418 (+),score=70.63 TRINITY_DN7372_c3_g1_i1:60-1313(+)
MQKRVGVIGGGAAGLAACRWLLEKGHLPTVFEESDKGIGGIWMGSTASAPVIYDGLVTNLPKQVMQFHELDFKPGTKSYMRPKDMEEYLNTYADTFKLLNYVKLGCKVTKVQRDEKTNKWSVHWSSSSKLQCDSFDAVVVAIGHYRVPHCPDVPGVKEWGGRVMHAAQYRNAEQFTGGNVLIIGAKSSGTDLAREISSVAKTVFISDPSCWAAHVKNNRHRLPSRSVSVSPSGDVLLNGVPVVLRTPLTHVVYATGYKYTFPFMDLEGLGLSPDPEALYIRNFSLQMLPPKHSDSCFFMGLPYSVAPLPILEAQAKFAAAILSGTADMSPDTQPPPKSAKQTHTLGSLQWNYVKELHRRAGTKDLDKLCQRVDLVEQLYNDRVQRTPDFPGDPDTYRNVEYQVDWERRTWRAIEAKL